MPPITPSPHRFLTGKHRQQSPPKQPNASSVLGHQTPAQRDATPQRKTDTPNTSQFAQTPRFSFSKSFVTPSAPKSPHKSSLASALKLPTQQTEDVEETVEPEDGDDDDEMLLDNLDVEQLEALPTTESTQRGFDEQTWRNKLPYSPKRRRLEEPHRLATDSPAHPAFKHPGIPASALNIDPHRFTRGSSVSSSVIDDNGTIRRPAFLRSALAAPEQHEPLPEAFSPHRRGEKFVPGGMAATLQQWVIETGQSAAQSRRGQGYLRGEDHVLRVRVDSISGCGPLLARGRQLDGEETRLLLVVDGKKGAITDVPVGGVVGIRAPTWDIEMDGGVWTVGVDWKVLPQL